MAGSWLALSGAMDAAVLELTQAGPGMAVVATGGYGRKQLCAFSDIDLMLVVAKPVDAAPPVFRALWDAGLAVGHAIRTPGEAAAAALERTDTLCSLLDMRLIGGDVAVFEQLQEAVARCTRLARLRQALASEEAERRRREPYHLQAVNVKSGRGGLRALQSLRWLALAEGRTDLPDLSAPEAGLLVARQAIHVAAGRRHDTLDYSLRRPAASAAGLSPDGFLRQTYQAVRAVDDAIDRAMEVSVAGPADGCSGRLAPGWDREDRPPIIPGRPRRLR